FVSDTLLTSRQEAKAGADLAAEAAAAGATAPPGANAVASASSNPPEKESKQKEGVTNDDHRLARQGAARPDRRGDDGVQEGLGGGQGRHRVRDRRSSKERDGASFVEIGTRGPRGNRPRLHPPRGSGRGSDRGRLRDRLRGADRRFPDSRAPSGHAGRRDKRPGGGSLGRGSGAARAGARDSDGAGAVVRQARRHLAEDRGREDREVSGGDM